MALAGLAGVALWLRGAPPAAAATPWRAAVAARTAQAFPRSVGAATIAAPPARIVAASVLTAELLLATVERERIAGVLSLAVDPRYSEVAAAAAACTAVGAAPEQLLAVRPDLVLLDEYSRAEIPLLLGAMGVPVVRTQSTLDFAGIADNVRLIGWATGCDHAAEAEVERFTARIDALRADAAAVAAWRIMNLNGELDTYGARSLLDAEVRAAGARHLPAEHGVGGYAKLDVETVLAWRPDALVVGVEQGQQETVVSWLRQHPGLGLLPCVQRARVIYLPNSLLGDTSPRAIGVAEAIQRQLLAWGHP